MLSDRKSQNLGLRTKKDPTGPTPQQTRAVLALLHLVTKRHILENKNPHIFLVSEIRFLGDLET